MRHIYYNMTHKYIELADFTHRRDKTTLTIHLSMTKGQELQQSSLPSLQDEQRLCGAHEGICLRPDWNAALHI